MYFFQINKLKKSDEFNSTINPSLSPGVANTIKSKIASLQKS